MTGKARTDFTENLEAVARGVRRLEEIRDPILREAISAALRLREREVRLDPASRYRMRNTVLAALEPATPSIADRVYGLLALLGKPAPMLVRSLLVLAVIIGLLGGATVASADSLPDDLLYGVKLAGEQLRLAVAVSPEDRASVELSIAEHRLDEAERLATAGREDDAIIATAAYGSSLADAAADLASIESTDPRTAALVTQMQTTLAASQRRIAATATRLAGDPRTVATAEVLASVGAIVVLSKDSPATRIADQAAAITARLAGVASDRANRVDPRRTEAPRAFFGRTDEPRRTVAATSTVRPTSAGATRPLVTPEPATTIQPNRTTTSAALLAPANPSAARQSAEKAREAAEKALEAAAKAKRAASRTPSPSPVRR